MATSTCVDTPVVVETNGRSAQLKTQVWTQGRQTYLPVTNSVLVSACCLSQLGGKWAGKLVGSRTTGSFKKNCTEHGLHRDTECGRDTQSQSHTFEVPLAVARVAALEGGGEGDRWHPGPPAPSRTNTQSMGFHSLAARPSSPSQK